MVKVSIIVPVFNMEKYIERCLNSLVNQTLEDIEIILVNDASNDNSLDIMKRYEAKYKSKIKVINSKENLRQGGAKNLGLKMASGEYIGFVDSDDWVDISMYEKLYNKAVQTNSDVVDCDLCVATNDSVLQVEVSNTQEQIGMLTEDIKRRLILNTGRIVTKIFLRELFINNNIKFPQKLTYEDNAVAPVVMMYAQKMEKVNEPLYYYFKNIESTTRKGNSFYHFDRLETSIILLEEFKQRNLFNIYKEEVEFKFIKLYYINTIYICLLQFETIPVEYLVKMRMYMKNNIERYRENKYFKEIKIKDKIISKLNDINPYVLAKIYKPYRSMLNK